MYPPRLVWLQFTLVIVVFIVDHRCHCTHVKGIWSASTSGLLKVITRFGFQKTDVHHQNDTAGYIFGNITSLSSGGPNWTRLKHDPVIYNAGVLLLANRTLFKHVYGIYKAKFKSLDEERNNNKTRYNKATDEFCKIIYQSVRDIVLDRQCSNQKENRKDFIRYVPCPTDGLCTEPHQLHNFSQFQLTFVLDDLKDTSFWYVLLLPCQKIITTSGKNQTCTWRKSSEKSSRSLLSYDLWVVNGNPETIDSRLLHWDHHFSAEQPNLWLYICLNISYIVLLTIQIYALSRQKTKNLSYLFTLSLALHTLSYFFICLHKIVFSHNGSGFETLYTIAEIMKIMSTALLMLFVLIIARGCPYTKPEIFSKTMLVIMATTYTIIRILLFAWVRDSLNIMEEVDEYHTVPGWIGLGFRIILMLWFIYELRHTMLLEQDSRKLKFYQHFGAGMLVWFIHLPLVALVAIHIDMMWRIKIIAGFSSMADLVVYAILTRTMWDTNANQFLINDNDLDELDYYDCDDNPSYVNHHSERIRFSQTASGKGMLHRSKQPLYHDNDAADPSIGDISSTIKT